MARPSKFTERTIGARKPTPMRETHNPRWNVVTERDYTNLWVDEFKIDETERKAALERISRALDEERAEVAGIRMLAPMGNGSAENWLMDQALDVPAAPPVSDLDAHPECASW